MAEIISWGSRKAVLQEANNIYMETGDREENSRPFPGSGSFSREDSGSHSEGISLPRAVLAGFSGGIAPDRYAAAIRELEELARSCSLRPVARVIQYSDTPTRRTLIGSGKVEELRETVEREDADIVVFNESLSPMQVRNLEQELDTEVLDRTGIILQIFSERARTRESRLQVQSAKLQYMLPRLSGMGKNLSRQGGGSGRLSNKGAGEEKLELDRRRIEHQIDEVRRKLEVVERERDTQRNRRLSSGMVRVSLVGYTNAGKSTLMNALLSVSTDAAQEERKVFEKNMLFATLDTSVRRISAEGFPPFLLSDTVGFIRDLPHTLVSAFRSTLDEVKYADLLLEVVDCSDPECEEHIRVTAGTLKEIGAGDIPILYVYNKADAADMPRIPLVRGDRIYMSARTGQGLKELLELITEETQNGRTEQMYLFPYGRASDFHYVREKYGLSGEEYLPEGIKIRFCCRAEDDSRLAEYVLHEE